MAAPIKSTVDYNERLLIAAMQLRGAGENGSMTELVDRADTLLRTGKLPDRQKPAK
jgi:hypothetical protein